MIIKFKDGCNRKSYRYIDVYCCNTEGDEYIEIEIDEWYERPYANPLFQKAQHTAVVNFYGKFVINFWSSKLSPEKYCLNFNNVKRLADYIEKNAEDFLKKVDPYWTEFNKKFTNVDEICAHYNISDFYAKNLKKLVDIEARESNFYILNDLSMKQLYDLDLASYLIEHANEYEEILPMVEDMYTACGRRFVPCFFHKIWYVYQYLEKLGLTAQQAIKLYEDFLCEGKIKLSGKTICRGSRKYNSLYAFLDEVL